ncbi:MAG: DUF5671 domain-containing protein [Acidobacteriota bacterium]
MTNAADRPIVEFIDHARSKGMDHTTIRMLLLSAGWKEKDIARAMTEHGLEMPIPAPPDVGGAREAFLHLVAFAALYTAAVAGVSLVFSLVNLTLPDMAITQYASARLEFERSAIRWEIAALVVSCPVLIWLSWMLLGEMRGSSERVRSPIRRWLTYLTLFFAAVAIGVDLMTLVWSLLGGEMSLRFLLKVLTVFAVAGAGFYYYFVALRMSPEELAHTALHRRYGWSTAIATVVFVIAGIALTGTPGSARIHQLDARRVDDVRLIYQEAMRLSFGPAWTDPSVPLKQVAPLPGSLDDIARRAVNIRPRIADPETGRPYEYAVSGTTTFRVCATFGQARENVRDVAWNHGAGRHCWSFDGLNPIRPAPAGPQSAIHKP